MIPKPKRSQAGIAQLAVLGGFGLTYSLGQHHLAFTILVVVIVAIGAEFLWARAFLKLSDRRMAALLGISVGAIGNVHNLGIPDSVAAGYRLVAFATLPAILLPLVLTIVPLESKAGGTQQ